MVKNVIVVEVVTTITSIRTLNAGGIAFSTSDTVETNPGNLYSNVNSFFSDLVLAGTGNAQITIGAGAGAVTESIVGVFLDFDSGADDFGIRTANTLPFAVNFTSTLSGSLDVAGVDIDDFNPGTYVDASSLGPLFAEEGTTTINVSVVPEPSTFALMVGMAFFATCKRRR